MTPEERAVFFTPPPKWMINLGSNRKSRIPDVFDDLGDHTNPKKEHAFFEAIKRKMLSGKDVIIQEEIVGRGEGRFLRTRLL